MKNKITLRIFTIMALLIVTSCSKDSEDLSVVSENLNKELVAANLDLENKLNSYNNLLNKNDTSFVSEQSITTLHSVLNVDVNNLISLNRGTPTILVTENQKSRISTLSFLLSNSESPDVALEILKEDYKSILDSNILTDDEKTLLLVVNNSIEMSVKFMINKFKNSGQNYSYGRGKSWWQCVKHACADLTDDLPGQLAVGVFPGPCCAAIIIGGTINYYNQ